MNQKEKCPTIKFHFFKIFKKDLPWISPLVQDIVASNISDSFISF